METRRFAVAPHELVECYDDGHRADQATRFLARSLRIERGARVAEAGCGTGVLAMLAARCGADRVAATDVDPCALQLLHAGMIANGIHNIDVRQGSLLAPLPSDERWDAIVAVLPQKPSPDVFDVRYAGGVDGAELLVQLIHQAAERLRPGGELWLYHHSIAAPLRVAAALDHAFHWGPVRQRLRYYLASAYEDMARGLLAKLEALRQDGKIWYSNRGPFLCWWGRILHGRRR